MVGGMTEVNIFLSTLPRHFTKLEDEYNANSIITFVSTEIETSRTLRSTYIYSFVTSRLACSEGCATKT